MTNPLRRVDDDHPTVGELVDELNTAMPLSNREATTELVVGPSTKAER